MERGKSFNQKGLELEPFIFSANFNDSAASHFEG